MKLPQERLVAGCLGHRGVPALSYARVDWEAQDHAVYERSWDAPAPGPVPRVSPWRLAPRAERQALAAPVPTNDRGAAKGWRPCTPAMPAGRTDHVWSL